MSHIKVILSGVFCYIGELLYTVCMRIADKICPLNVGDATEEEHKKFIDNLIEQNISGILMLPPEVEKYGFEIKICNATYSREFHNDLYSAVGKIIVESQERTNNSVSLHAIAFIFDLQDEYPLPHRPE